MKKLGYLKDKIKFITTESIFLDLLEEYVIALYILFDQPKQYKLKKSNNSIKWIYSVFNAPTKTLGTKPL